MYVTAGIRPQIKDIVLSCLVLTLKAGRRGGGGREKREKLSSLLTRPSPFCPCHLIYGLPRYDIFLVVTVVVTWYFRIHISMLNTAT